MRGRPHRAGGLTLIDWAAVGTLLHNDMPMPRRRECGGSAIFGAPCGPPKLGAALSSSHTRSTRRPCQAVDSRQRARQAAEAGNASDLTRRLDGAAERRVLGDIEMQSAAVAVSRVRARHVPQMRLVTDDRETRGGSIRRSAQRKRSGADNVARSVDLEYPLI